MHLCYLLPPIEFYSPQSGGAVATMAMQQGRRLQAQGVRISVIAPHEDEPIYDVGEFFPLLGVTRNSLHPLKRRFSSKVRRPIAKFDWLYFEHYRAAAKRVLSQLKPDAVLCFNDWQTPGFVKDTLPDTRVFLRLSNECRTKLPDIKPNLAKIERVFALSGYIRDWTAQHFGIEPDKFTILPNGADLDSFFPAPDSFERILDTNRPVRALFISRINRDKGPDIAADAVALARAEGTPISLTMAGGQWFYGNENESKDPFVSAVKTKADLAGASYLGHVTRDRVPDLFREHDILLFPIRWNEPMSQVVFEAMASGCVVISSPLGGVPEACGDAALWAEPGNVTQFAAYLKALSLDRPELARRKRIGIERAAHMTWDRNAAIFSAVLNHQPVRGTKL